MRDPPAQYRGSKRSSGRNHCTAVLCEQEPAERWIRDQLTQKVSRFDFSADLRSHYERAFVMYNQNACYGQGVHVLFKGGHAPPPPMLPPYIYRVSPTPRSQDTCAAAPSKSRLEGIFGFATPAYPGSDGYFRFTKNDISVLFIYGGDYRVEDLVIRGRDGIAQITKLLDQIVSQNDRGKFLQRDAAKIRRLRGETYFEKYECLSIDYSQEYGAENSGYASVRVTWDRGQRH